MRRHIRAIIFMSARLDNGAERNGHCGKAGYTSGDLPAMPFGRPLSRRNPKEVCSRAPLGEEISWSDPQCAGSRQMDRVPLVLRGWLQR